MAFVHCWIFDVILFHFILFCLFITHSYSYFFESFENSVSLNNSVLLTRLLKYMLFSKLLTGDVSGITSLVMMKQFLAYRSTTSVQAMLAAADAYKEKSLEKFHAVKEKFHTELVEDEVVADKLEELYTEILEQVTFSLLFPFFSFVLF